MAKIRIVETPPGAAPLWVRQAWVGLEIPLIGQTEPDAPQVSATGGPATPENIGGYEVHGGEAMQALHQAGHTKAADWWNHHSILHSRHLIFSKRVCVLIQETNEAARLHFIMGPRTAQPFVRFVLQVSFVTRNDQSGVIFSPGILNPLPSTLMLSKEEAETVKPMPNLLEAFVPEGTWCLISDGSAHHKLFLPEGIVEGVRATFQYTVPARIPNVRGHSGLIDPDIQYVIDGDNGFMS